MNRIMIGLFGLFTGVGIGTVVGILYAPDTGTNTRDKITFRLDKYKYKLEELLEQLIQGRNLQENTAKSEGERVITDAREKAEKLLIDVEELLIQIKGQK
ncbi:MAG: YtxH domain-containing protein [Bacteroidota bacterium]|nr:YtxH domain-containing protein [Bacteroidota bacterium]